MKYRGVVLLILIVIAAVAIALLPDEKKYYAVAEVGAEAPDFELYDSKGKLWRLSDLRGKVVYMNFWATWCTTCEAEMPSKERLYEKMQGKPFQMLGMLFRDDPGNLPDYYKTHKVSPPTLISPNNESAKIFGITGVPETFIIDKDGIIREKIVGPREWDSPDNVAMIEKWL
jgi:peroxiredoxin